MRKKVGIIKRVFTLLLIFLLSINSFAAIVSDNDGSAFITKAEFDALKSSFQSQIDSYNQSIDAKIDGAIASYLAGISLSTTREYSILVDNYQDIRWMDAHKMKLQYYKYTANDQRTKVASAYITPFYENHRNIRGGGIRISDNVYADFMDGLFRFTTAMVPSNDESKIHYGANQYVASDGYQQYGIPIIYIRQIRNEDNGKYYILDLNEEHCIQNAMHGLTHKPVSSGGNFWSLANQWVNISSWQFNSPDSDTYWDYAVGWNNDATTMRSKMNVNNSWFAAPYALTSPAGPRGAEATDVITDTYGKYEYPKYWQWSSSAEQFANDTENLKSLMLGTDDDVTVNVLNFYQNLNVCDGSFYDFSDSEVVSVPFYCTYAAYNGGYLEQNNIDNIKTNNFIDPSEGKTKIINIGIPLCPRKSLRTLLTGKYIDTSTGQDLSIGAGLPIAKDIDKNQQITISFNYEKVNTEYGSSTTPNKKIYVSVKKSDFEATGASDYFVGTVNGGSSKAIKEVEVTGGNVKIVMDCQKGDDVWLRIANTTNGSEPGIYAKMSNLAVSGVYSD